MHMGTIRIRHIVQLLAAAFLCLSSAKTAMAVETAELARTLTGYGHCVLSPDGNLMAISRDYGTIHLLRVSDLTIWRTLVGHAEVVDSLAFSPDGKMLVSCSRDASIRVWHVSDGSEVASLHGSLAKGVDVVVFSPDGALLATAGNEGRINLHRVSDWTWVRTLNGRPANWHCVTFSPDGQFLASVGDEEGGRAIRLWRVSDGSEVRGFAEGLRWGGFAAFSPNGQLMAWGKGDKTVFLSPVQNDVADRRLLAHEHEEDPLVSSGLYSGTFSPDGKLLASRCGDWTVCLYRVSDGREVKTLAGHTGFVMSVAFSPDGKLLASGSQDKTIRLWRVSDGREVEKLSGHTDEVYQIAFTLDGRFLVSRSTDGTIRVWPVTSKMRRGRLLSLVLGIPWKIIGLISVALLPGAAGILILAIHRVRKRA